jgi:hypothetical protein
MNDEATTRSSREGERRLPMALAVVAVAVLFLLIPADFRAVPGAHVGFPVFLFVLLVVLIVGDPGRIDRATPWLRTVTGVMIAIITFATAASAGRLVVGLLNGADFSTPSELLTIGVIVWTTNVIAFALWYWHLDSGGPAARVRRWDGARAAFRFPEEDIDELFAQGWYPQFVDYLALSFNTSTAFGSADATAIRHWSKLMQMAEGAISLILVALVVARAVNIL